MAWPHDPLSPNAATPSGAGLNEHHQRRLAATLQRLDRGLGEVLGLAEGLDPGGVFAEFAMDLSPAQQRAVVTGVADFRAAIRRLGEDLGLPPAPPRSGVSWAIQARLLTFEVDLAETKSSGMKGYGSMPRETAARLDAAINELEDLIEGLLAGLAREEPGAA